MFWKKKPISTEKNSGKAKKGLGKTEKSSQAKKGLGKTEKSSKIKKSPGRIEKLSSKIEWIERDNRRRREAFRYTPTDGSFLSEMIFLNKTVKVLNISAGGLSFNNINFNENDIDRVILDLKGFHYKIRDNGDIKVIMKIVYIDNENICHAIFEDLSREQSDTLHQYILEKQKQDIRREKELKR